MTAITATSASQFQQLRNRQNDLYRKTTAALINAVKNGNTSERSQLSAAMDQLEDNDKALRKAYVDFQASNLAPSDAEKDLVAETKRANKLTRNLTSATKIVTAVGDMADVLARLVALF